MSIALNGDGIISGVSSITNPSDITVGTGASVFSPAANTLAFGTNDVERFRVTSTGQLQATSASDVRLTLGSSGTAGTNDSNHIRGDGTNLKFMNASGGVTVFENNGTERFRITNNGVTFNGDTAAANALDDYEEGTFTPNIEGNATAGVIGTGTISGKYTKIGNVVKYIIQWSNITFSSGPAGIMKITGLPFVTVGSNISGYVFQEGITMAFTSAVGTNGGGITFKEYGTSAVAFRVSTSAAWDNYMLGSSTFTSGGGSWYGLATLIQYTS